MALSWFDVVPRLVAEANPPKRRELFLRGWTNSPSEGGSIVEIPKVNVDCTADPKATKCRLTSSFQASKIKAAPVGR